MHGVWQNFALTIVLQPSHGHPCGCQAVRMRHLSGQVHEQRLTSHTQIGAFARAQTTVQGMRENL